MNNNSKQQRPRTGFRSRGTSELNNARYEEITKYIDMLYEEKYEDKIKGARFILFLFRNPEIIVQAIEEHPTLYNILSRTLRDEHKKIMELTLSILAFFSTYSHFHNFHFLLSQESIGGICMSIIEFQITKYEYRKDEMIHFATSEKISKAEYQSNLTKFLFWVTKQDRILIMSFGIWIRWAEDYKTEYKMVKKDIVGLIIKNLNRPNINWLNVWLLFLKKLSIFQINKDAMVKGGILDKLMDIFVIQHPMIWAINIEIWFNLSFDQKFRLQIIEKSEYFLRLTEYFKRSEFRTNILRLLYNWSWEEKSKPLFFESECLYILYELISKFPEKIIGAELAAWTLNLTNYPPNANKIAKDGRIKGFIERALKNTDFEWIKIVKNIIKYGEDPEINDVFENYIDNHFMKILSSRADNNEFLIETIEILSYIETDWSEMLIPHNLIQFFETSWKERTHSTNDDLLIAVIFFLGNVASIKDCAPALAKSNIISLLQTTLSKKFDNASVIFGIIIVLYQWMPFDSMRNIIWANKELIKKIMSCLKCNNEEIIFVSMRFLEIVQIYDSTWSEIIKKKKFRLYNKDLLEGIKQMKKEQKLQKQMMQGGYIDDRDEDNAMMMMNNAMIRDAPGMDDDDDEDDDDERYNEYGY